MNIEPRRIFSKVASWHRQRSFMALKGECVDRLSIPFAREGRWFSELRGVRNENPARTTIARNYLRRLQKRFSLAHRVLAHLGLALALTRLQRRLHFLLIGVCPWSV